MQRLACRLKDFDGSDRPPLQQFTEVVQRRNQVAQRLHDVGLEVTAANDALIGDQVYEDKRPLPDRGYARDDGAFERQDDGTGSYFPEGQGRAFHASTPPAMRDQRSARTIALSEPYAKNVISLPASVHVNSLGGIHSSSGDSRCQEH